MVFQTSLATYEIRRKAFHLIFGGIFIFLLTLESIKDYLGVGVLLCLLFAMALSMVCKYLKPKKILEMLALFDKPEDMRHFPGKGAVYYLMGVLSAILFFDKAIASASIAILAIGDPASHLIGKYYGKTRLAVTKKKLLEGTLGAILLGGLAASFFVPWHVAFFGALLGMGAEAFELGILKMDDNFFIPVVSGIAMHSLQILSGIL